MVNFCSVPRIPIVTGVALCACRLFFRDLKNSNRLQTLSSAPSLIAHVTIKITSACYMIINSVIYFSQSTLECLGGGEVGGGGNSSEQTKLYRWQSHKVTLNLHPSNKAWKCSFLPTCACTSTPPPPVKKKKSRIQLIILLLGLILMICVCVVCVYTHMCTKIIICTHGPWTLKWTNQSKGISQSWSVIMYKWHSIHYALKTDTSGEINIKTIVFFF